MRKTFDPKCHLCGAACGPKNERIFIAGYWHCGSCVYRLEHADASPEAIVRRTRRRARAQAEQLFESGGREDARP